MHIVHVCVCVRIVRMCVRAYCTYVCACILYVCVCVHIVRMCVHVVSHSVFKRANIVGDADHAHIWYWMLHYACVIVKLPFSPPVHDSAGELAYQMTVMIIFLTLSVHAWEGYSSHPVCVSFSHSFIQQRISKTTAFQALKRCRDREICKVSPFNVLEFFVLT